MNWDEPLAEAAYLQHRLRPSRKEIDFLPLRDLLALLKRIAPQTKGPLFDYGCGGSPYREVFAHCAPYIAADIVPGPRVDVILKPDGLTPQQSGSVQTVLSSQVLEHVEKPDVYLAEAFRILAPGGTLILTTHGMFLEHGCPQDYYRWTSYGLASTVRAAGFEIVETVKITPGARASAHLLHTAFATCRARHSPWLNAIVVGVRKVYAFLFRPLVNSLVQVIEPRSDVPFDAPDPIYIGVGVIARKPATASCASPS